jgi:DNA polymerase III delta prime subunit
MDYKSGKICYTAAVNIGREGYSMGDHLSTIIKPSLEELFLLGWERCRVILFAAPCGCGKTATAAAAARARPSAP